jgi:hypothetical protein
MGSEVLSIPSPGTTAVEEVSGVSPFSQPIRARNPEKKMTLSQVFFIILVLV